MTRKQFTDKIEQMGDDELYTEWKHYPGKSMEAYDRRNIMVVELRDRGCFERGNECTDLSE
jgi:hypothetical protein